VAVKTVLREENLKSSFARYRLHIKENFYFFDMQTSKQYAYDAEVADKTLLCKQK
jgi:hypothetical protein